MEYQIYAAQLAAGCINYQPWIGDVVVDCNCAYAAAWFHMKDSMDIATTVAALLNSDRLVEIIDQ